MRVSTSLSHLSALLNHILGTSWYQKKFFWVSIYHIFLLLLIAFLYQLPSFGCPISFADQEFYMWSGGQILRGKIPYIDFWDRKQVGLFYLYSLFYRFGEYRFVASSIVATLALFFGSLAVAKSVKTLRPQQSILRYTLAGAVFSAGLIFYHSEAGQAEGFIVPLEAIAVSITLTFWEDILYRLSVTKVLLLGLIVMSIIGIAIEVKATAIFLGVALGITYLLLLLYKKRMKRSEKFLFIFIAATLWIIAALLPTALVVAWYWEHNWLNDWWFANISSGGLRDTSLIYHELRHKLERMALLSCIGITLTVISYKNRQSSLIDSKQLFFIIAWWWIESLVALGISHGSNIHHYGAPIVPPTVILIAILIFKKAALNQVMVLLSFISIFEGTKVALKDGGWVGAKDIYRFYQRASYLMAEQPGCTLQLSFPIIADSNPISHKCIVSPLFFPEHLTISFEQSATPFNQDIERHRALESRPLYILSFDMPNKTICYEDVKCPYLDKKNRWSKLYAPKSLRIQLEITLFLHSYYTPILSDFEKGSRGLTLYKLNAGTLPNIYPDGEKRELSRNVYYPIGWERRKATYWPNRPYNPGWF